MKKILSISLVFLLLSCGDVVPVNEVNIQGEWEWVESTGGIAGLTLRPTPDTDLNTTSNVFLYHFLTFENDQATLRVDNDSEDGLRLRISDYVVQEQELSPAGSASVIQFSENLMEVVPDIGGVMDFFQNPIIIKATVDSLVLADNCTDCFQHTFIKNTGSN